MLRKAFLFVIILLSWPFAGRAQWSLKNNLLYDAALTPNLGVEARFSQKWTGALNVGFSPFETGEATKTHAWNVANYTRWFRAFRNCPSLTQIRIPAGCAIGEGAFDGCGTVYVFAPADSPAQTFCEDPANPNCIFIAE